MGFRNWSPKKGQKKARVQSTPGRVMGTFPLLREEGGFGHRLETDYKSHPGLDRWSGVMVLMSGLDDWPELAAFLV